MHRAADTGIRAGSEWCCVCLLGVVWRDILEGHGLGGGRATNPSKHAAAATATQQCHRPGSEWCCLCFWGGGGDAGRGPRGRATAASRQHQQQQHCNRTQADESASITVAVQAASSVCILGLVWGDAGGALGRERAIHVGKHAEAFMQQGNKLMSQ